MTQLKRRGDRWLILGVVCLVQLVVILDNTILNVAIPSLTKELGATTAQTQWVIGAYSLVQAGLLITAGGFADRYGRKLTQMLGLAFFGAGSLAGAFATEPAQLIAARAGMGIGGALLLATNMAIIVRTFDAEETPKALTVIMGVASLGLALGPVIGGVLLAHFWWGSVFLVNVPVCFIGLVAVAKLVPESKDPQGDHPDLLGALLSTVGMTAIVYAVIQGPEYGWTSGRTLLTGLGGVLVMAAFIVWERRTPHPLLDMSFFSNPRFRGAVSGGVLVAFGLSGSLYLLTQHLQFVLDYGPLEAGLRLMPMALTLVALNLTGVGVRVTAKLAPPVATGLGLALMAAGLASIAVLGRDGSYPGILLGLVLMGAGVGCAKPAMAGAVMTSIPPEKAGVGSGLMGTISEVGNSLGVACLGAVLTVGFAGALPAGVPDRAARSLPDAVAAAGPGATHRVHEAFADSLTTAQLIGAVAVLLGGLVASWLLRQGGVGQQDGSEQNDATEQEAIAA
ncbi:MULTISPECIES: MFS transporter [Streptomyces]|uniref:MFS transporter n=1 Tax=Streptomyces gilvifuscus TaxID=1550617 RepID=A0ABT5G8J9_9ACTN|nr:MULTISPECIES: MFS transporter [Streptomyces]MBK3643169.1 MFS transporter [Streptomyces sp. MBT33]MDC2961084.1 MFS transporter [Streptomyces gilvifuscus]